MSWLRTWGCGVPELRTCPRCGGVVDALWAGGYRCTQCAWSGGHAERLREERRLRVTLNEITVRELADGYEDKGEDGVFGYGGRLDIRPPYQREFIYKDKQRDAVITTVTKGFPLNVMYWALRDDGGYEVIDGQQRTISVCQYVAGDFAYLNRIRHGEER